MRDAVLHERGHQQDAKNAEQGGAEVGFGAGGRDGGGLASAYLIRYTLHVPGQQKLNAVFYRSRSGVEPVCDWLKGLPKADRKAIGEDIAYVQYKWPIGKPRIDHLRGPVWEVRTRLDNRIARTLFAVARRQMVLLHGFIKKTQRTPGEEIDLAIKRFKEWQHGET